MTDANLTTTNNLQVAAREIDFVTQFSTNWTKLREIMGIIEPVRKPNGTVLKTYTAEVSDLKDGKIGEGELIPYSKVEVKSKGLGDLTIEKYKKGTSIEAVEKYGAENAINKTDTAFMNKLQGKVLTDFYEFLKTGTLKSKEKTLQSAIAMSIGKVKDKFEKMDKDATEVIVFVNTLDVYEYVGTADISIQSQFGVQYLKDFLGADTVIVSSKIERGTVIATPVSNIDLYYIDPADSDFAKLGLEYRTIGDIIPDETSLIGYHVSGNYDTAVGDVFAIMGMKFWTEFIDAVAVTTFGEGVGA